MLTFQRMLGENRGTALVTQMLARLRNALDRTRIVRLTFRDLVIPAAILLYLRWLEHYESEQEAAAAFDGREYVPSLPDELRWKNLKDLRGGRLTHQINEILLPEALGTLEEKNRDRYIQEFVVPKINLIRSGPFAKQIERMAHAWIRLIELPDELRDEMVALVGEMPFDRVEERQVGEQLLSAMIREGATSRSAYYMPQAAADLIVDVARPQPGERIYDPCFGSGNLLVTAIHRLREENRYLPTTRQWEGLYSDTIFGVDHYPDYWFVGMVRITLAGIDHPALELGDVLSRPKIKNVGREGFDCILAVPPWRSLDQGSHSAMFDIQTKSSEGLFIQHIAASLRPGGRAVVALPASFLFSSGSEKRVRKMLLEDYRVEGVIGLPPNLFKPYTSMDSGLLVFRRERPALRIRFMSCDAVRTDDSTSAALNTLSPAEVAKNFHSSKLGENVWETPIKAIESREWDLSPKPTGADELDDLLEQLSQEDRSIRLIQLGKVCEVVSGISYLRDDITEFTVDSHVGIRLPLIRVGDLAQGVVEVPSRMVTNPDVAARWKGDPVKVGDLLVSITGTVGKVGIVGKQAAGAIVAKSLATLKLESGTEAIDPRFLARLLQSQVYRDWFAGHSRGVTIANLSVKALRTLRIPLPPLLLQRMVVDSSAEGVDAFNELLRIVRDKRSDFVARWLENSKEAAEVAAAQDLPADQLLLLVEQFARAILPIRNKVAHEEAGNPQLAKWVMAAVQGLSEIAGISDIPEGVAKVTILLHARVAMSSIANSLVIQTGTGRARQLTEALVRMLDRVIDSMLAEIRIEIAVEPAVIVSNEESQLSLLVKNLTAFPLRDFFCKVAPTDRQLKIPYLAERSSEEQSIRVLAAKGPSLDLRLIWNARRLDGKETFGEFPISVAVRESLISKLEKQHLGANPYVTGTPIVRPEMFFGRETVVNTIQRNLANLAHRNVILLEGNRRAGKSSILLQLERPEVLPDWVVARCDFQGASGDPILPGIPTDQVFSHLAQQIADAGLRYGLNFWPPIQAPYDSKKPYLLEFRRAFAKALQEFPSFEAFKEFLEAVIEAIAPKRLLLMLDEFDRIQEGIDSGVTSRQVPQNIRFILNNYPDVTAILTGSRRMTQMRKEYWSVLFGLGNKIEVTAIARDEARRLVTEPVAGRLIFPPSVVDRIVDLCACQPFLIQQLCSKAFDRSADSNQISVSLEVVDDAANDLVNGLEHFEAFWDFAGSERARFILCIVHRLCQETDGAPVTLPMIEDELERAGVKIKRDELVGDELKKLIELELLRMEKDGQYRLAVPLLALWISRNKDFEDQRERAVQESSDRSL
jgi:type I restriction enzyme M protein